MIRRGEVWWANLPAPRGSGPGYGRPVLVVQADAFNRSRIATVVAVVLTSNIRLAEAPGNVVLERRDSGLPKRSVANVSQVVTLDKAVLSRRVKAVSARAMQQVETGLRLVVAL